MRGWVEALHEDMPTGNVGAFIERPSFALPTLKHCLAYHMLSAS